MKIEEDQLNLNKSLLSSLNQSFPSGGISSNLQDTMPFQFGNNLTNSDLNTGINVNKNMAENNITEEENNCLSMPNSQINSQINTPQSLNPQIRLINCNEAPQIIHSIQPTLPLFQMTTTGQLIPVPTYFVANNLYMPQANMNDLNANQMGINQSLNFNNSNSF